MTAVERYTRSFRFQNSLKLKLPFIQLIMQLSQDINDVIE